jgi:hypothetical protein
MECFWGKWFYEFHGDQEWLDHHQAHSKYRRKIGKKYGEMACPYFSSLGKE